MGQGQYYYNLLQYDGSTTSNMDNIDPYKEIILNNAIWTRIRITAPPGTIFDINNIPIMIGRNGVYELGDDDGRIQITSLKMESPKKAVLDYQASIDKFTEGYNDFLSNGTIQDITIQVSQLPSPPQVPSLSDPDELEAARKAAFTTLVNSEVNGQNGQPEDVKIFCQGLQTQVNSIKESLEECLQGLQGIYSQPDNDDDSDNDVHNVIIDYVYADTANQESQGG